MYELLTKDGEVISKKNARSEEDAVLLFADAKKINIDDLLHIYMVRKVIKK